MPRTNILWKEVFEKGHAESLFINLMRNNRNAYTKEGLHALMNLPLTEKDMVTREYEIHDGRTNVASCFQYGKHPINRNMELFAVKMCTVEVEINERFREMMERVYIQVVMGGQPVFTISLRQLFAMRKVTDNDPVRLWENDVWPTWDPSSPTKKYFALSIPESMFYENMEYADLNNYFFLRSAKYHDIKVMFRGNKYDPFARNETNVPYPFRVSYERVYINREEFYKNQDKMGRLEDKITGNWKPLTYIVKTQHIEFADEIYFERDGCHVHLQQGFNSRHQLQSILLLGENIPRKVYLEIGNDLFYCNVYLPVTLSNRFLWTESKDWILWFRRKHNVPSEIMQLIYSYLASANGQMGWVHFVPDAVSETVAQQQQQQNSNHAFAMDKGMVFLNTEYFHHCCLTVSNPNDEDNVFHGQIIVQGLQGMSHYNNMIGLI